MSRSPKLQRLTSMAVPALLAANAMVLVLGLAGITDDAPAGAETVTYIQGPDGTLTLVDPDTPEGWKAIAEAEQRGEQVVTVAEEEAPEELQQQMAPSTTLAPGVTITVPDVDQLLDDTESTIVDTIDRLGDTVDSVVDTVTDVVDDTAGTDVGDTVDPLVDDTTDTLTTTVSTVVSETRTTATTVAETVTTVVTTPPTTAVVVTTTTPQLLPDDIDEPAPTTVPDLGL